MISFDVARSRASAVALVLGSLAGQARAENPSLLPPVIGASERQLSDPRSGLALSGYDPLSYLLDGAPRAGLPRYESVHAGLVWRFASAANRAAFGRDPLAFLPRLGGYDAVAAAAGRVVAADPTIHAVRAGRLYLFRTEAERRRFLADEGLASKAEAAWPGLAEGLVSG